jgi:uncharacterized integral membrane protein
MSTPGRYDPAQPNAVPYTGAGDPTPPDGLRPTGVAVPDQYTEPVAPIHPEPVDVADDDSDARPIGAPTRKHSRAGAAWVALVVAAIVMIFLLIFIVQNSDPVDVRYFGFAGTLSLGVAMLFAAIAGALTAGLLGTVRILQLRARARRAAVK